MSYKNQFYLEAELDEDDAELKEEEEDMTSEDIEDADDNYDDDIEEPEDDDEDEKEEEEDYFYNMYGDDDEPEEDEPRPMTYDDLDDYDDDISEDEEDDMSDFGSDDSDINNDYDEKDADMLNKLISSETSAVQEYLDANMETSNDNLRRLYVDIANEERFHIEQLMYAKAKLTGEKYEPSDPKVKREYEELCNSGMDEESAMSTACDKCAISNDKYYTNDSINDIIDDIDDFTESFVESVANNLTLASLNDTQEVYMEYADMFYMEGIQNATDESVKKSSKVHPIRFIIKTFRNIVKFIRKIITRIREFLRKVHIKDMNKINWIKKHGIKDLFKEGIWLYTWSDRSDHGENVRGLYRYLDLFDRVMATIQNSMHGNKEALPVTQTRVNAKVPMPIEFKNIEHGVRILRNVIFSKEKVIITENNEQDLEKIFFGVTDNGTSGPSWNIYNFLDILSNGFESLSKDCEQLLQDLQDLEGNYDSVYSKNPKLYNLLISSTKALSKEFGKFSKVITHDTTTIMQLNSGLYDLMKEYDESKKYNKGESEEAQEDIANNKFQKKKTPEDLKRYYPNIDENREPGE